MVDAVSEILLFLDEIKKTSKKIGNSQRCFFYYFFKALFDKERQEFCSRYLLWIKQNKIIIAIINVISFRNEGVGVFN